MQLQGGPAASAAQSRGGCGGAGPDRDGQQDTSLLPERAGRLHTRRGLRDALPGKGTAGKECAGPRKGERADRRFEGEDRGGGRDAARRQGWGGAIVGRACGERQKAHAPRRLPARRAPRRIAQLGGRGARETPPASRTRGGRRVLGCGHPRLPARRARPLLRCQRRLWEGPLDARDQPGRTDDRVARRKRAQLTQPPTRTHAPIRNPPTNGIPVTQICTRCIPDRERFRGQPFPWPAGGL